MKITGLLTFFLLMAMMLWWSIFGLPFKAHNEGMLAVMWTIGLVVSGVMAINEK